MAIVLGGVYPAQNAPVAQWIERLASNQEVVGSIPAGRTFCERKFALLAQLVEQIPLKDMVGGSNPSQGKIKILTFKARIFILLNYFLFFPVFQIRFVNFFGN